MCSLFLMIVLSFLVGNEIKAEEINSMEMLNWVDSFLQTILQDEPIPYEFEEKFFW